MLRYALAVPLLLLGGCSADKPPTTSGHPDVCSLIPAERLNPLFDATLKAEAAGPLDRAGLTLFGCHYTNDRHLSVDITTALNPNATSAKDVLGGEHDDGE